MPGLSTILAYLGFAGALASWIAGAVFCARALMACEPRTADTADARAVMRCPLSVFE